MIKEINSLRAFRQERHAKYVRAFAVNEEILGFPLLYILESNYHRYFSIFSNHILSVNCFSPYSCQRGNSLKEVELNGDQEGWKVINYMYKLINAVMGLRSTPLT